MLDGEERLNPDFWAELDLPAKVVLAFDSESPGKPGRPFLDMEITRRQIVLTNVIDMCEKNNSIGDRRVFDGDFPAAVDVSLKVGRKTTGFSDWTGKLSVVPLKVNGSLVAIVDFSDLARYVSGQHCVVDLKFAEDGQTVEFSLAESMGKNGTQAFLQTAWCGSNGDLVGDYLDEEDDTRECSNDSFDTWNGDVDWNDALNDDVLDSADDALNDFFNPDDIQNDFESDVSPES